MRIVFLDFDGVVNICRREGSSMFDEQAMHRLHTLCNQTAAKIVVSSSWRETFSLEKLHDFFEPDELRDLVIGVTPVVAQPKFPPYIKGIRQREVEAWLSSFGGEVEWIALDDAADLFDKGCPWLVECDARQGFDDKALAKALELFLKYPNPADGVNFDYE